MNTRILVSLVILIGSSPGGFAQNSPAPAPAPSAPAKATHRVTLTEMGENKIQVVKVLRETTGLGLAAAKKMAESAPITVKDAEAAEAAKIKKALEAVGAKVEVAEIKENK